MEQGSARHLKGMRDFRFQVVRNNRAQAARIPKIKSPP